MRIRPFIESRDYKALESWIDSERTNAMWCANHLPYPLSRERLHALLKENAAELTDGAYVATEDTGEPVGFFCYSISVEENTGFFKLVIVDKKKRGAGLGEEMLRLALRYAFEITGVASARLNVFAQNTGAKRCYEKVGFWTESVTKNGYTYRGEPWNICHMVISKK